MKDNAAQHTSGTAQYWQQTQFQVLVQLLNWYIQAFFGEEGGRNPHHSDSES